MTEPNSEIKNQKKNKKSNKGRKNQNIVFKYSDNFNNF
jgi:hypothetical protein